MRKALLIALLAFPGCDSILGPIAPDAVEIEYRAANSTEGLCYITPSAIGISPAELTKVQLAEYGAIIWSGTGETYWGRSRIAPGDTLQGRTMRVYARGTGMIWAYYTQDGENKVVSKSLSCIY